MVETGVTRSGKTGPLPLMMTDHHATKDETMVTRIVESGIPEQHSWLADRLAYAMADSIRGIPGLQSAIGEMRYSNRDASIRVTARSVSETGHSYEIAVTAYPRHWRLASGTTLAALVVETPEGRFLHEEINANDIPACLIKAQRMDCDDSLWAEISRSWSAMDAA